MLGAAVVGLGTVVAVDHTHATTAPPAQTASLSAAQTAESSLLASSGFAATGQVRDEASHVFDFFATDTGLTWKQIEADLLRGETLGQVAGAHAAKVEADALNEVRAGLSLGVVKGVITHTQATRLVDDAQDAISVLMAAHLNRLLPAGG
jgi:hypothetical protein